MRMDEIPSQLLAATPDTDADAIRRWWDGLAEADRREVAILCDARREASFFGASADDAPVPAVRGGRFIPHDDAWGQAEWGPDHFEYLLEHSDPVRVEDLRPRVFHYGCTRHPAARVCLEAGSIPRDFRCPVASADCPMQGILASTGGRSAKLLRMGEGTLVVALPL
jgi:hypothetical protein